jgi:hypothetical protein
MMKDFFVMLSAKRMTSGIDCGNKVAALGKVYIEVAHPKPIGSVGGAAEKRLSTFLRSYNRSIRG